MGWGKAIVATGHKILTIAFQMLKTNTPYRELGDDYFDRLNPARAARKLIHRLEALGHQGSPFRPSCGQMRKSRRLSEYRGFVF